MGILYQSLRQKKKKKKNVTDVETQCVITWSPRPLKARHRFVHMCFLTALHGFHTTAQRGGSDSS